MEFCFLISVGTPDLESFVRGVGGPVQKFLTTFFCFLLFINSFYKGDRGPLPVFLNKHTL